MELRTMAFPNGVWERGDLPLSTAFKRPYGTRRLFVIFPALKCRATFNRSSGTTEGGFYRSLFRD